MGEREKQTARASYGNREEQNIVGHKINCCSCGYAALVIVCAVIVYKDLILCL